MRGLFPQDIPVKNILGATISPEGEVTIKVQSRRGTSKVLIPELTPEQGEKLVDEINSLIGNKKNELGKLLFEASKL